MNRAVGAHGKGHPERVLGLRRPHRHRHDLATVRVAEPDRLRDGVDVELVQLERHPLAHEPLRLRVETDVLGARHLLDEDDDLHGGEPIHMLPTSSGDVLCLPLRATSCGASPQDTSGV